MHQEYLINDNRENDNNYINFYDPLKASYENYQAAEHRMKKYGYDYDKDLSTDETKVFYNPNQSDNKKLLVTFRGSTNLDDWINTNPSILLGGLQNTRRYKDSESTLNQAKQKYNSNGALLVGDSLGGSLSSAVSNKNDTIYTFNKGAGSLFNHNTHNKSNEHAYRWNGDIVSIGSFLNTRKSKIIGNNRKNILKNHNIDNLKNYDIVI
jgi:hypothetical protein